MRSGLMKATVNCFNQCDSKEVDLEEKALLALFAFAQNSENLSVLKTALELGAFVSNVILAFPSFRKNSRGKTKSNS